MANLIIENFSTHDERSFPTRMANRGLRANATTDPDYSIRNAFIQIVKSVDFKEKLSVKATIKTAHLPKESFTLNGKICLKSRNFVTNRYFLGT